jgi:hypothetical protein
MAADVMTPMDVGIEPKPSRAETRFGRRRILMVRRMAKASTPMEKLIVALDYFRATAHDHAVKYEDAAATTDSLTQMLLDKADQLAKPRRRNR